MTSTTNTIADRILDNLLGGDGCRQRTRLGIDRRALVERIAAARRHDFLNNVNGWEFADGSVIEESGTGWDTPDGWAARCGY